MLRDFNMSYWTSNLHWEWAARITYLKNQKVVIYLEELYSQQVYDGPFLHWTVQL